MADKIVTLIMEDRILYHVRLIYTESAFDVSYNYWATDRVLDHPDISETLLLHYTSVEVDN